MSVTNSIRNMYAIIFGFIIACGLYQKHDPGFQNEDDLKPNRHWAPLMAPCLLPTFLLLLFIKVMFTDFRDTLPLFGATCLSIFAHMSVYFILLIVVSPLLRRRISAGACAALWLLPNMLYICEMNYMQRNAPKRIIRLHGQWLRWAVIIWLIGAAAVLVWKLAEHFRFRRMLRKTARAESSAEISEAWTDLQHRANIRKARIPLLRSGKVSSPLSVGLFPSTTFVVLPDCDYTLEDAGLILRHELIHIIRRDAQTKLFLTLCLAVCWFNPLMWVAIRRCSEDLELSCDELVLEHSHEDEKKRYAGLILSSAGETKGFTSSLAPKAESLRYRLKQIMTPDKRANGGFLAGLILVLLLTTSGTVAFAYGDGTVAQLVFDNDVPVIDRTAAVNLVTREENGGMTVYPKTCTDPDALMDYISGLYTGRLCGNYGMTLPGSVLEVMLPGTNGPRILILEEDCLKITDLGSRRIFTEIWYLDREPDWSYIASLLVKEEPADPIPQPPDMEVVFGPSTVIDNDVFVSSGKILENTLNGQPSDHYTGWQDAPCMIEGIPVEWADIGFTFEIPPTELSAVARDLDGIRSQSVDPDENGRMTLLPYSARYIVQARWRFLTDVGIQIYCMEYEFDVIIY